MDWRIRYLDRTLQQTHDLDLEIQTLNYISEVGEEGTKKIPGWPIIVRKVSWKSSLVVGLWQNLSQITMIDNQAIKWASKIVVQSLQIQYLPSCRGPGKLMIHNRPIYISYHHFPIKNSGDFLKKNLNKFLKTEKLA